MEQSIVACSAAAGRFLIAVSFNLFLVAAWHRFRRRFGDFHPRDMYDWAFHLPIRNGH